MNGRTTTPKVAIVCDWLTNMGGAEQVVLAMHEAFPDAPIYTSTYTPEKMPAFKGLDIRTTYLQRLPAWLRNLHKFMPILRVHAFRKLDLSDYDVILSSASAEAKQARKTRPDQIHICYCHTPIRYYWSHYKEYKADPGYGKLNWLIRLAMPLTVPSMKKADYKAAQDIDYFLANSETIKERIAKYYKQASTVLYPPIDTKRFSPQAQRGDYYVALGRQVPYKRIGMAVEACTQLGLPLQVYGNGSEHAKMVAAAGPTISFYTERFGDASDAAVETALNSAKGFIFPAEEDFGIVPVEAMAAGAPVVAYGVGGVRDSVTDGKTGVFYTEQTVDSLVDALQRAEKLTFSPTILRNRAKRFDKTLFDTQIKNFVYNSYERSKK